MKDSNRDLKKRAATLRVQLKSPRSGSRSGKPPLMFSQQPPILWLALCHKKELHQFVTPIWPAGRSKSLRIQPVTLKSLIRKRRKQAMQRRFDKPKTTFSILRLHLLQPELPHPLPRLLLLLFLLNTESVQITLKVFWKKSQRQPKLISIINHRRDSNGRGTEVSNVGIVGSATYFWRKTCCPKHRNPNKPNGFNRIPIYNQRGWNEFPLQRTKISEE